jgi:4-hydroxy-2-oxoheptanedioate aldolase
MQSSRLRQRLADGERLLGLCLCYPAAGIIEGIACGWDFLWIDCQHGQIAWDNALHAVRAADLAGVEAIVRVPNSDPGAVGPYADLFCAGLMVPMVNSARQAAAIADAVRFPPRGNRSYGGRRPIDLAGRDYYRKHAPLVVCQIETPEAVEHAFEIASTDGVDTLLIGTDDLKIQLGLSVDAPTLETEPIVRALEQVADAARAAGKAAGCVAPCPGLLERCVAMGYQLLVGGSDAGFLRSAARERLETLRGVLNGGNHP